MSERKKKPAQNVATAAVIEPAVAEAAVDAAVSSEVADPAAAINAAEAAAETVSADAATETVSEKAQEQADAAGAENAGDAGSSSSDTGDTRNKLEQSAAVQNGVSRLVFVLLALLVGIVVTVVAVSKLDNKVWVVAVAIRLLAFLLILNIYSQSRTSAMKMPWIMLIMVLPVVGVTLYLLVGNSGSTKKMRLRFAVIDTKLFPKLPRNCSVLQRLKKKNPFIGNISSYLKSYATFPVYQNTDVTFYPDASEGLEAQKEAMRKAEKFIFMEYHAIEDAEAFHELEDILVSKVKEGVEVRLFYDDMGSIGFINVDFIHRMQDLGIHCRVFNPFAPGMRLVLNNRDHRKITVVDNKVGFTGGYNIANEYFNLTHPYGHWKDTGIRLEGDAVRSLTVMFLEMWNAVRSDDVDDRECDLFLSDSDYKAREDGFIHPYADSPLDGEQVGENVYISLVEHALESFWIMTPYLILTDEMVHALGLAAKRGVDVRVITPGIPDKKLVYSVTRSYYHALAKNGVKVYEYTPGFLHAKQCVVDEETAVCGTINLDYRSLYHHFENACMFTGYQAVADMKKDFDETLPLCRDVTEEYRSGRSSLLRLRDLLLRFFAPLL